MNGDGTRILEMVNPEGDLNENMMALRDNMQTLQGKLLGQAAQVLAHTSPSADFNVTGPFAVVTGTDASITTSGGLLVLFAQATLLTTNGYTLARILLDGSPMATGRAGVASGTDVATVPVFWAGMVANGKHTIALDAITNSDGATVVQTTDSETVTNLWALEFIS